MIDLIEALGIRTWETLWLPVIIWTIPAGLIWLGTRSPRASIGLRIQLVQAALLALPVAVIVEIVRQASRTVEFTVLSVPSPAPVRSTPVMAEPAMYSADPVWTVIGLLTLVAALAAAWGCIRFVAAVISLVRLRAASRQLQDSEVIDMVRDRADEIGYDRPVELRTVPGIGSPMSAGILSPIILIPDERPADIDLIVLHELIHHRRRDVARAFVARMIRAVFYAHPLTHALCSRLDMLVEMDCDSAVLSTRGVSRKDYASLLLRYAMQRPTELPALKLGSERSLLTKRLEAMQHPVTTLKTHPVAVILGVVLLGAVTTFAACTDSFVGADENSGEAAVSPKTSQTDGDVFVIVEEMPVLIGGLSELQSRVEYPDLARRAGIEGRVYVQFVVNTDGVPEDIVVTRGLGAGADQEAVRAVSTMRFTPGKQRGQIVPVKMSLPVTFTLDDRRLDQSEPVSSARPQAGSGRAAEIYDSFNDVPYDFVVVATTGKRSDGITLTDEQAKGMARAAAGVDQADVVRGGPANQGMIDGRTGEQAVDESTFIIIKPRR